MSVRRVAMRGAWPCARRTARAAVATRVCVMAAGVLHRNHQSSNPDGSCNFWVQLALPTPLFDECIAA
jgi:hypothetical protein